MRSDRGAIFGITSVLQDGACSKTILSLMYTLGQQDVIKLNNNAITMSFMFNIYDFIHMFKNKRFSLYFDNLPCEMQRETF